jgi:hypothetical protein
MTTTYRLHVNDITMDLLNSIKAAFKDKEVEIIVTDKADDTETLRNYPADEDTFGFWQIKEEDVYQEYLNKKKS